VKQRKPEPFITSGRALHHGAWLPHPNVPYKRRLVQQLGKERLIPLLEPADY
jgi:hypothetical protein